MTLLIKENFQEIPVWLRPYVYRAWARAFHSGMVVLPYHSPVLTLFITLLDCAKEIMS